MKLEQLEHILEIEKQRSISKAARELYMGQSSLSGSLNSLENEINVKLFERMPTGVEPTADGKEILKMAQQAVDICQSILTYNNEKLDVQGEITVLIVPAYKFLIHKIALEFKRLYPEAGLRIQVEEPYKIIEYLSEGRANIGIVLWEVVSEQDSAVLEKASLRYEAFKRHNWKLYVGASHPYAKKNSIEIQELKHELFVAYSSDYWRVLNKMLQVERKPLFVADYDAAKQLVKEGEALLLMPDIFGFHEPYCAENLIKEISITDTKFQPTDYLLLPTKHKLTILEQKMVVLLREMLNS